MTTSIRCSVCEKGQGTCLCAGCQKYYCMKDFKSHREMLFNKMEEIIGERNDLQEKINKVSQYKVSSSPLLAQIDEWQRSTIEKVKQAAEQARQQAIELSTVKRTEITTQFETLSQELIQLKETEDFVEHDLLRLNQKIRQVNRDLEQLNQPSTIELRVEESDQTVWNRRIYITDKSAYIESKKRKHEATGQYTNRLLSENSFSAIDR